MITKKCDACHEEKPLFFFRNVVDTGYVAYCKEDAIKMGYMTAEQMHDFFAMLEAH